MDFYNNIKQLKWLHEIGIKYYFSNKNNLNNTQHFIESDYVQNNSRDLSNQAKSLEELRSFVLQFNGCNLKKLSSNTVFSDGIEKSKIMLIGEAPGANEDTFGIPFCGASGQLLDKMLGSIELSRKTNVYITNIVFWRPPANRRPTLEEIKICMPFTEKHIYFINPKLIILIGNTAVTGLLGKHEGINKMRNEFYYYTNQYLKNIQIPVTAIFHPAYLLRQPSKKKQAWFDLLKIQKFIKKHIM